MKNLVVLLSIAWLAAGIVVGHLWRMLDEQRAVTASLQARVRVMQAARPVHAAATVSAAGAASAPVPGAEQAAAPAGAAPVPAARPASSQPDRAVRRTFMRAMLAQEYPDLGEELGLAPDELDKFLDLLADQQADLAADAPPMNGLDPAAMRELAGKAEERRVADQAAIAAMLGDKYTQWQSYQKTLPARQQVTQLRSQLAASGSTLPEAQVRPLMAALDAEMKRIDQDSMGTPPRRKLTQQEQMDLDMQREVDGNRRLVTAATPYLSAQQLDSYRQMLDRQTELGRTMMQGMQAILPQAQAEPQQ